ncbi:Hsp33 family molecular chaperone HslO [Synechococcus sp. PCC 7502]|uniref:Hsp33 family molecular chaperone HslO n=1 Tax=Synechococcus sp. PCC 7502 TaxID=1173263 RepID=UPI00059CC4A6|nr:Hsp33 family molecular chaperone HslO [Synechococcus sp. PCC 7502]
MGDHLIRATAANGGIKAVAVTTTNLTAEARRRHKMSKITTKALGQTMTAALLLASGMKQPQARVSIRINSDGDLGLVFADAGFDGTVRGYVDQPQLESAVLGQNGSLQVIRDVGYGNPYSGNVEIVSSEVSENITYYLVSSEQIPSALLTGVLTDDRGVDVAGGLLLQIMPQARRDHNLLEVLDSRVRSLSEFTSLLKQGMSLRQILEDLLGDIELNILPEVQPVKFKCRCTFDRVLGALRMFGVEELRDMINEDHGAEAICQFCSEVYRADRFDLEKIILNLQASSQSS